MGNHYIPREYLRGFAQPSCPNALWQFDKSTMAFSAEPVAISKIAQQRSFYDAATERDLNERIEIPGNRVLRRLRSGDLRIGEDDRVALAVYIATMMIRVPHHRARGAALAPQVLAKVSSELRDQIREHADHGRISGETASARLAETDAAEARLSRELPQNVREQILSPWPTESMIELVYGMHWRFVCGQTGQHFVATDNPAFIFACFGLGTERSELTFPISNELAIFGSWVPVKKHSTVVRRSQFVKESNRRLIGDASRFIYCGSKPDWIVTVAKKKGPRLSRIQW